MLRSPITLEALEALDNRGLHNFSLGVLDSYFRLTDVLKKGRRQTSFMLGASVLHLEGKTFVYDRAVDVGELESLRRLGPVYSIDKLEGLEGAGHFDEICYDLHHVFSPEAYANAKKRHQHLVYPARWIESRGIDVGFAISRDVDRALALHDEWAKRKLDDPKTFKMMFPGARYSRCVELSAVDKRKRGMFADSSIPRPHMIVANRGDEIVGVRVVWTQPKKAEVYDLAFFCNTWTEGLSQLSNYVEMLSLDLLRRAGFRTFNCGAALNKHLKAFKCHVPHNTVRCYTYSKRKGAA